MWLFWLISIEIGWYNINLELIIDIVVISLIIGITIYITWKKNKINRWKDAKYIDDKIWIDEQAWFVVEGGVKENIKKHIESYGVIKWVLGVFFQYQY